MIVIRMIWVDFGSTGLTCVHSADLRLRAWKLLSAHCYVPIATEQLFWSLGTADHMWVCVWEGGREQDLTFGSRCLRSWFIRGHRLLGGFSHAHIHTLAHIFSGCWTQCILVWQRLKEIMECARREWYERKRERKRECKKERERKKERKQRENIKSQKFSQ